MRTSTTQFELMVSYMERHGDLSRPCNGPQGRVTNINRWAELVTQQNADATGDTKNEEKWRKTWSDLKNNTKRKAARINKAMSGTGGGPTLKIKLSGIEERVLAIINPQAASGMTEVLEVFVTENDGEDPGSSPLIQVNERENEDWNVPGSSSQPPIFEPANQPPSPPATPPTPIQGTPRSPRTPRRRRHPRLSVGASPKRRTPAISQSALTREAFANSDREWREFNKEKFVKNYEIDKERLRLREIELQQQARWQELFVQFLLVLREICKKD